MQDQKDLALEYHRQGIVVLAIPLRQKHPAASWGRWQKEMPTKRQVEIWFGGEPRNAFAVCGVVSRLVVLDCDTEAAHDYWKDRIAEELAKTACARTGKGWHYYFRLPDDLKSFRSWKGDGFDVQGDGKGVVCPPSIHPTGRPYVWVEGRGIETALEAPPELYEGGDGAQTPGGSKKGQGAPRSTLRHLLERPPTEGERNNWLTRVAGHYATRFREEDLFEHHVRWAAQLLTDPLPEEEIEKTIRSIWDTEQDKVGPAGPDETWRILKPDIRSGWLVSGGDRLLTPAKIDQDGTVGLEQWADADFRAIGIMRGQDELTYDIEIRAADGRVQQALLPATTLGDGRALSRWLAIHDVKQMNPDRMTPRSGGRGERLQAYLSAQNPPSFEVVDHLGWHEESQAFLTHDGVIRAAGDGPFEDVKPAVGRDRANYHYGFAPASDARTVLREIMTFHDLTTTSVFGAWWAAVLLKPQLMAKLSQFPFMAIQAPSESGKSTGFFAMLLEAGGLRDANMQATKAATRDYLTAHSSGIVWVDDLDDPAYLMELVRGSTVGASVTKKGIDHTTQVKATLRGALLLSGEALGLSQQKALADRAIFLEVGSPKGRRSVHDPNRPQWDDIVALRQNHPDLTAYAGRYVQAALAWAPEGLGQLEELRPADGGRFADKIAVLRVGARLLAAMIGDREEGERIVQYVDQWSAQQHNLDQENTLTMHVLPTILRSIGRQTRPDGPDAVRGQVATPVLVRDDEVWFSPALCADWWERRFRGRVNVRTETAETLTQQAKAAGYGGQRNVGRKLIRFADNQGHAMYWRIPNPDSSRLLARAEGGDEGDIEPEQLKLP